jgi:hypothetical protein
MYPLKNEINTSISIPSPFLAASYSIAQELIEDLVNTYLFNAVNIHSFVSLDDVYDDFIKTNHINLQSDLKDYCKEYIESRVARLLKEKAEKHKYIYEVPLEPLLDCDLKLDNYL